MKKELVLKYSDSCLTNTYTYQRMKELSDEIERLEKQLQKAKDIEKTFRHGLQIHKEMTDEQFRCYMAWCKHSDIPPVIVMAEYVFPKVE